MSLRERSHKTQSPRFGQSSHVPGPQFLKSPGKNTNLEAEPHKSVTVTGVKQNWSSKKEATISGVRVNQ